jgi:hypothetical protein
MIRRNVLPSFFASTLKMEVASSSEIYFYHSVRRQISFTIRVVTTLHLVFKARYLEGSNKCEDKPTQRLDKKYEYMGSKALICTWVWNISLNLNCGRKVNGQLHVPAALHPRKEHQYSQCSRVGERQRRSGIKQALNTLRTGDEDFRF